MAAYGHVRTAQGIFRLRHLEQISPVHIQHPSSIVVFVQWADNHRFFFVQFGSALLYLCEKWHHGHQSFAQGHHPAECRCSNHNAGPVA